MTLCDYFSLYLVKLFTDSLAASVNEHFALGHAILQDLHLREHEKYRVHGKKNEQDQVCDLDNPKPESGTGLRPP